MVSLYGVHVNLENVGVFLEESADLNVQPDLMSPL
jgi:hypothetical protein